MNRKSFYNSTAFETSKLVAKRYSTSFSAAMSLLDEPVKTHLYNIYGYVRVADELVDTLRPKNTKNQLTQFIEDTNQAIESGVSLNLTIHSFAITSKKYNIPRGYLDAFFTSMRMDQAKKRYSKKDYDKYIYGSAEVVGLMCLCVFTEGKRSLQNKTLEGARSLGSAFQKVNFLRDMASDKAELGRVYFPKLEFNNFNEDIKTEIILEIRGELKVAKEALKMLPRSSRYGVILALNYYSSLLNKLEKTPAKEVRTTRIRINNLYKTLIYMYVYSRKLLHTP